MTIPNIVELLLLPAILSLQCVAYSCTNTIPGVNKMVKGVDITTLDLVPLDGINPHGMKGPILNITCLEGDTWTTPTSEVYQRPDQVWAISTIPRGYSKADIQIARSSSDVRKEMSVGVKIGGGYGHFAFSSSVSYEKMQRAIMNSSKQIEDVSSFESAIRIDWDPLWAPRLLDSFAKDYIDNELTGTYENNSHSYKLFIEKFGTHYFTQGYFGGKIRSYMETSSSYSYSKSDEQLKVEAQASYNGLLAKISASVNFENGKTSESSQFKKATSKTIKYYGGTTNLLAKDGLVKWQKSVDGDPWLFSGHLSPIYELIEDDVKKSNLKTAIDQHVQRAYLKELVRIVSSAKLKSSYHVLDDLLERINAQLTLKMLDLTEAAALKNEVEFQLIVPDWFSKGTWICFTYRAEKSGTLQCNGRHDTLPETFCALPNSRTTNYMDNSSEHPGGCVMQWAITSSNPPDWFLKTQICYKHGHSGPQTACRSMDKDNDDEHCSPVNEMTPEYIDNTMYIESYCQLSWKLMLPDHAPVWLKRSELCFQFHPQAVASQCGVGPNKGTYCARTDSWTQWHRDNTQHKLSGGCYMSWGWNLIQ